MIIASCFTKNFWKHLLKKEDAALRNSYPGTVQLQADKQLRQQQGSTAAATFRGPFSHASYKALGEQWAYCVCPAQ